MSNLHGNVSILNRMFRVKVPVVATYTQQELELYGIPVDIVDGQAQSSFNTNRKSTVVLSVDRIIDIYIQGYPISVLNEEDAKSIHSILINYINGDSTIRSIHHRHIDDERIPVMEEFANEILNNNAHEIIKKELTFGDAFSSLQSFESFQTDTSEEVKKYIRQ